MVKKKIFLTIGMPVYNSAMTISESLDSVISQINSELIKKCDIEILICDNCSTDNTVKIIKAYIKKYSKIKIRCHKNKVNIGATKNIETVVKQAFGEFIWFLGDDSLYKFSLMWVVNFLLKHKNIAALVVRSAIYNRTLDKIIGTRVQRLGGGSKVFNDYECFFNNAQESSLFLSSVVVNKSVVSRYKINYDFLYPHLDMLIKLSQDKPCGVIDVALVKERRPEKSKLTKFHTRAFLSVSSLPNLPNALKISMKFTLRVCFLSLNLRLYSIFCKKETKQAIFDIVVLPRNMSRYIFLFPNVISFPMFLFALTLIKIRRCILNYFNDV